MSGRQLLRNEQTKIRLGRFDLLKWLIDLPKKAVRPSKEVVQPAQKVVRLDKKPKGCSTNSLRE